MAWLERPVWASSATSCSRLVRVGGGQGHGEAERARTVAVLEEPLSPTRRGSRPPASSSQEMGPAGHGGAFRGVQPHGEGRPPFGCPVEAAAPLPAAIAAAWAAARWMSGPCTHWGGQLHQPVGHLRSPRRAAGMEGQDLEGHLTGAAGFLMHAVEKLLDGPAQLPPGCRHPGAGYDHPRPHPPGGRPAVIARLGEGRGRARRDRQPGPALRSTR